MLFGVFKGLGGSGKFQVVKRVKVNSEVSEWVYEWHFWHEWSHGECWLEWEGEEIERSSCQVGKVDEGLRLSREERKVVV